MTAFFFTEFCHSHHTFRMQYRKTPSWKSEPLAQSLEEQILKTTGNISSQDSSCCSSCTQRNWKLLQSAGYFFPPTNPSINNHTRRKTATAGAQNTFLEFKTWCHSALHSQISLVRIPQNLSYQMSSYSKHPSNKPDPTDGGKLRHRVHVFTHILPICPIV